MEHALVSVCMVTYNHEDYIREAIEGVLSQKTSFPFELIIGEDCSTDKTREICLEYKSKYPNIIKLHCSETNKGSMRNFIDVLVSAGGKYIALCDGDDYWTDQLKLQKQVEFLDLNPDCGLVHTYFKTLNHENKVITSNTIRKIDTGNIFDYLILDNQIGTLTVVVTKNALECSLKEIPLEEFKIGDYPLWLQIAKNYEIGFIPDETAVYRQLSESAFNTSNQNRQIEINRYVNNIKLYFAKKYASWDVINLQLTPYYKNLIYLGFQQLKKDYSNEGLHFLRCYDRKLISKLDYLYCFGSRNPYNKIIVNNILRLRKNILE